MKILNKLDTLDNIQDGIINKVHHVYRDATGTGAITSSPYSASKWDVTDEEITEYKDGMIIDIKIPIAGNGTYGTVLQINNLGYKPVVYNINSMIGTRYGVNSHVFAVYNSTQTASWYNNSTSAIIETGCWQVMDYDANTTSIYTLMTYRGSKTVTGNLYRYILCLTKDESTLVPINSVMGTSPNGTTATTKTMTTESFDPFGMILYYGTATAINKGNAVAMSQMYRQNGSVDLRYSLNCGQTLDSNKDVYLVVEPQSDGMVKLASTPWSQDLPTEENGLVYLLLGHTYSKYQIELYPIHPGYYYKDGKILLYTGAIGNGEATTVVLKEWTSTQK